MSHADGVEAFRPDSPSSSHKRKRESGQCSYVTAPTDGASGDNRIAKADNTLSLGHEPQALKAPASLADKSAFHASSDSDDMHQSDQGDTLQVVGSASSLASVTSSSIFSANSQTFAHNGRAPANGSTPLTNHTESSPPKNTSPSHPARLPADAVGGASPPSIMSARDVNTPPPQMRPEIRPPQGAVKGYRAVYDPDLDSRLSKEDRKRAKFKAKDFGTEVRYQHLIPLLSLHIT